MHTDFQFSTVRNRSPLIVGTYDSATAALAKLSTAADDSVPTNANDVDILPPDSEPTASRIKARSFLIAVTGDYNEDARLSAIARAFGVPVLVPGRPELSTLSLVGTDPAATPPVQHPATMKQRELELANA